MDKLNMDKLKFRKEMKKKKPKFIRQDAHKKRKLAKVWRRPRGLHSKVRLAKKGYRRKVSKGFKAPKEVRFLHPSGLDLTVVNNLKDLNNIDPKKEGILIASAIGVKKKLAIIKRALELKIAILNIKSPKDYIKSIEEKRKKKKEVREKKKKEKEEKKKIIEKKAKEKKAKEEKEELTDKVSEEEKKKQEKLEKDKLLTKRT